MREQITEHRNQLNEILEEAAESIEKISVIFGSSLSDLLKDLIEEQHEENIIEGPYDGFELN